MTAEPNATPPVLAAGNWIWLLGPARQDRALVIAPAGSGLAGAIGPHFQEVVRLSPNGPAAGASEATLDFVAIDALEECADGDANWLPRVLADVRPRLRPGGCLLLTFSNPFWGRRLVGFWYPGRYARRRKVRRVLAGAGFGRMDAYFLQPFPAPASSIIPDWPHAAHHHEQVQHIRSRMGRLRPLIARLGAQALLYPGCAYVAYA
ncbi:MAG TPA: hypothetical protein VK012_06075 [Gemmatimonadales bacterium]|nr:hypothetical protein [Gemmatimonadales bacterium]